MIRYKYLNPATTYGTQPVISGAWINGRYIRRIPQESEPDFIAKCQRIAGASREPIKAYEHPTSTAKLTGYEPTL